MFALERIHIIKNLLAENRAVEVHALSDILDVSEVTIRRDLMKLEREGYLTRTHGGAVINAEDDGEADGPESPAGEAGLDEIASVGARLVKDGDVLMLTDGAANYRLAARLEARRGLTVLTNDIRIALVITEQKDNRVVLLGGDLDAARKALYGSLTLENLRHYYVNRLFVEVDGVTDKLQATLDSQAQADMIRAAMETADEVILVCPASRFARNAFYRLGPLSRADRIITNVSLDDAYKTRLFSEDIQLFTAVDAFEGRV